MRKFAVTIRRTEYREHTFVVRADRLEQAEEDIHDLEDGPHDYDWNSSPVFHADEEVMGVTAVADAQGGEDCEVLEEPVQSAQ